MDWIEAHLVSMRQFKSMVSTSALRALAALEYLSQPCILSIVGVQFRNQMNFLAGCKSVVRSIALSSLHISGVVEEGSRTIQQWEGGENGDSRGLDSGMSRPCKDGLWKEALDILNLIDKGNVRADSNIYARLLEGCVARKALAEGKRVHTHIMNSGFKSNVFLLNTIVNMYCKCGSVDNARQVFDKMFTRDMVSWTAMIAGYAQNERGEEALKLFPQMQRAGMKPNEFTFSSVLRACASLLALEQGCTSSVR